MIYLDQAATSFPKPEAVYRAVDCFLREVGASPGRGTYARAREAEREVEATREILARLFGMGDPSRIVFSPNATVALNLALKGLLRPGAHVVTSCFEHNAVWRPLKALERTRGISITEVSSRRADAFLQAIRPDTQAVVVTHASNVTGVLLPIEELGPVLASRGIPLVVDAAQTAGAYPIDVGRSRIALLAFTGHKSLLGPPGTGGLCVAEGVELEPLLEGGTGAESIRETQPEQLPFRFEPGTVNAPGLAGLRAGVEFVLERGVQEIRKREMELTAYALELLETVPGLTVYGHFPPAERVGIISFNLEGARPEEVGYALDRMWGIAVRVGLHCAPRAHRAMGTLERGTVRLSLGLFNTERELEVTASALEVLAAALGGRGEQVWSTTKSSWCSTAMP